MNRNWISGIDLSSRLRPRRDVAWMMTRKTKARVFVRPCQCYNFTPYMDVALEQNYSNSATEEQQKDVHWIIDDIPLDLALARDPGSWARLVATGPNKTTGKRPASVSSKHSESKGPRSASAPPRKSKKEETTKESGEGASISQLKGPQVQHRKSLHQLLLQGHPLHQRQGNQAKH